PFLAPISSVPGSARSDITQLNRFWGVCTMTLLRFIGWLVGSWQSSPLRLGSTALSDQGEDRLEIPQKQIARRGGADGCYPSAHGMEESPCSGQSPAARGFPPPATCPEPTGCDPFRSELQRNSGSAPNCAAEAFARR